MDKLISVQGHSGFYIGENAAMALTDLFHIVFLRLEEDHIVTALISKGQVLGTVSGHGVGWGAASTAVLPGMEDPEGLLPAFARCGISFTAEGAAVTFEGREFPLVLADIIDRAAMTQPVPADDSLSVAERMRRWNRSWFIAVPEGGSILRAGISNGHYDMCWNVHLPDGPIYCRLGVSGYCDKGWAMKSTAVLRAQECRMLPDHREALLPYQPQEECFVENGCAFPSDGGWYWSVKDVTDDTITLNGCGGDVYAIYRPR